MADQLSVLKYYLYYKYRRPFHGRAALEEWQRKRLVRHLKYVAGHSRLYQGLEDLGSYPVIDKAFMMKHFDELNTVGIGRDEAMEFAVRAERGRDFVPKLKGTTVGLSSGTSGSRGIFLVSDREKNRWAGYILAKFLPGSILETWSIAFFMRADSNLYEAVRSKNIQFHFFDIYRDMEDHRQRLETVNPRILAGQPSLLLMIAGELRQGRLDIHPEVVISIAEVLEKEDEQRLRETFGLNVIHQVYQCTEGCLATTCARGTLHLNEDIVYIEREYLDERRFVPVVTDLERKAQPIIRYRLNDILVERKEPCGCKSPCLALEKIEGREDDMFLFRGRNGKEKLVFPDFIRRCVLLAGSQDGRTPENCRTVQELDGRTPGDCRTVQERDGRIPEDYRIVQEPDGRITVYADLTEDGKQGILKEFEKLAEDGKFVLTDVEFQAYFCEKGKKMKRVERRQQRKGWYI